MEVNNECQSDGMRIKEKKSNPKLMNLLLWKINVKRFGYNKPSRGL